MGVLPRNDVPGRGEIIDVREDMTLPQEVQANPGIVKVGQSPWGTDRDWRIESCTTDWSDDYVHELWPDPEPDQWILPIGSYRLALYQRDELWDWTPCLQIEPHGVYETEWTREARAIPPRSVDASAVEEESNGGSFHRITVRIAPGAVNTFLPTKTYRVDVIREDTGQSVVNRSFSSDENFRTPFTAELKTALPVGMSVVAVTSSVVVEGETLSSEPACSLHKFRARRAGADADADADTHIDGVSVSDGVSVPDPGADTHIDGVSVSDRVAHAFD
jgi:hypothetical protein